MLIHWPNARGGAPGYPAVISIGGVITPIGVSLPPTAAPATYRVERNRGRWVALPDIPPPQFMEPAVRDYLAELTFYLQAQELRSVVFEHHEGTITADQIVDGHGSLLDADRLDGSEGSAYLLIADLLTEILDVDGTGSGIDADKLDGVEGSGYALVSHTHAAGDITSGILDDARLPAEVPLTDESNSFGGTQTFGTVDINGGNIDGTIIGASSAADGTFGDLVCGATFIMNDANGDIGVFGQTERGQWSFIADPSGGGTQDAEARTAINAILDLLAGFGWMAAS